MVRAGWMHADPCPSRKAALQALLNIRLNSLSLLVEKVNPDMPCVTQGFGRLKSHSLCYDFHSFRYNRKDDGIG